ncbi:MAG: hypothetical protein LBS20_11710 [Prevotella sp.]|jgi:hypothetical protein|nr:hypothetical protein [Prevotella sp.]
MSNICINTINAEGASSQIDELIEKLSETFGDDLDINDNFADEAKSYASLSVNSSWKMPKNQFREITASLSGTPGLYIRIISEEPGEGYFEQSIFTNGQWSFDSIPEINARIHVLTQQGIEFIRKQIQEKGNIHVKEDHFWTALFVGDDGYGTSAMFRSVELESNGKLSVDLDDGTILGEDELTTNHILDLLSLIHEDHVTYSK